MNENGNNNNYSPQSRAHLNEVRDSWLRLLDEVSRTRERLGIGYDIDICAASKTVAPDIINSLVPYGLRHIGENRLNELNEKYEAYDSSLRVDYIGTLQSNKIRQLVGRVSMIQSLGTQSAAAELERVSAIKGVTTDVLVELNSCREENKSGVLPEECDGFFAMLEQYPHIRPLGIMTIGSPEQDKAVIIKYFKETYNIFIDIRGKRLHNIECPVLSMGMSDSYIEAIECGATMIRPGKAVFGSRAPKL